jgi:DNA processing protein
MRSKGAAEVTDRYEQAAVLALADAAGKIGIEWYRAAVIVDELESAQSALKKDWSGFESFDTAEAGRLADAVTPAMLRRADDIVASAEARGDHIVTVLDATYPRNLREIYNRPPFLFVRGRLEAVADRSVAVVGTRKPSEDGVEEASRLSRELAERGVTVLSGLAVGIDAAVHRAALDAGGRTVAVMGTGINRLYPPENEKLADRILAEGGALVSQFWPDAPPARWSFPMRNVVMSGMAVGTVVVEASKTSGAKMQARIALDHGKRVFLVRRLVAQEEWAQRYLTRGAQAIDTVDDVVDTLVALAAASAPDSPEQLTL